MKTRLLFPIALAVLAFTAFSCSKDKDPDDPAETVVLNMLNEKNGKTMLGNSDVYINNANNFYGPSCLIANLGKVSGLGAVWPKLAGAASQVAVEPGNGYVVCRERALYEFASGSLALHIDADYYKVYVGSQIKQENEIIGASVKFALSRPADYGLPAYDTEVEVGYNDYHDELVIYLPTSYFDEYEVYSGNKRIACERNREQLIIKMYDLNQSGSFEIYLRVQETYTRLYGEAW